MTKPNRWKCHRCGQEFNAWATVQRHVDQEHGGGRIECIIETRKP